MTNPNTEPALIEKIQKLLALAEGTSNVNEKSAAMAKATELLQANDLDLAQVHGLQRGDVVEVDEMEGTQPTLTNYGRKVSARSEWVGTLADGIAESCMCRALYYKNHITFVGKALNAKMALYIFMSAYAQITQLCNNAANEYSVQYKARHGIAARFAHGENNIIVWRNNYFMGIARAVAVKIYDQYNTFRASKRTYTAPNGASLVVTGMEIIAVNKNAVDAYFTDHKIKTFESSKPSAANIGAYAQGIRDAAKVQVHEGVGAGTSAKQLKAGK